jgi:ribosomal-protein-serine acetyltransferase
MFKFPLDEESELRKIELHHAEELNKLVCENYDHIHEWSPWLADKERPIEKTIEFVQQNLKKFSSGNGYEIGIWRNGKMAGQIGYNYFEQNDKRTEIGYWLGSGAEGKGLVTKACRALIDNAFGDLDLNRVEIRCGTENHKSRRVAERLGAKLEGIAREAEWLHHRFIDLAVYSILRTEWQTGASIQ